MTITFYSNYLNHHQIPFCNEMYKLLGDGFTFVETQPMEAERLDLGWTLDKSYPYCLQAHASEKNRDKSLSLAIYSDIIIHGSAPKLYMQTRLKTGKPAFRYSERFFKQGFWRVLNPRTMQSLLRHNTRWRNYPLYMLCASAYTAYDCARIFAYPEKMFKWGYFTEAKSYDIDALFALKGKKPITILWVGRFLNWKHPEAAIVVAKHLSAKKIDYVLNFIGDGEERKQVEEMARREGDRIRFLGTMKPPEVRAHMESADIFLFTSDFQEGWGAVLNEAMNSGCAVVASHAIGSAPFLIRHGVNGFLYENGNTGFLCDYVERLAREPRLRRGLGAAAYQTITEEWSPNCAAKRLVELCTDILDNRNTIEFQSGPCSKAEVITNAYRF